MATKRELLDDPNSCLNKAADDEPVFLLRAQDKGRARQRARLGRSRRWRWALRTRVPKIQGALDDAVEMERWREANGGGKVPD